MKIIVCVFTKYIYIFFGTKDIKKIKLKVDIRRVSLFLSLFLVCGKSWLYETALLSFRGISITHIPLGVDCQLCHSINHFNNFVTECHVRRLEIFWIILSCSRNFGRK